MCELEGACRQDRYRTVTRNRERVGAGGCDSAEPLQDKGVLEEDHNCREPGDHLLYALRFEELMASCVVASMGR